MNTRSAIAAVVAAAGFAASAGAEIQFDVIVSSGDFNVNGGTETNNAVVRFGPDGSFKGNFADTSSGLNDPRDVVLTGEWDDPTTTVLVNSGNFPPSDTPDNDRTLEYDLDGNLIGVFSDFSDNGSGFVNPGGAVFGTNGNFFVGSRAQSTVLEYDGTTGDFIGQVFDPAEVAFPRGFVFDANGDLFIGNGSNPNTGEGTDSILRVETDGTVSTFFDTSDLAAFSPLDVILSPDGSQLVVSSEFPFEGGLTPNAGSIVIIDIATGDLVSVLTALDGDDNPLLVAPRGLGFGPDGLLYASSPGTDAILRFDIATGEFVDVFATLPGLNGQALNFIPVPAPGVGGVAAIGLAGLAARRRRD